MKLATGWITWGGFTLSMIAAFPLYADQSCPLSNPIYKDLRSAATALEKKVLLPPGCEKIQQDLEQSGKQISKAAEDLSNLSKYGTLTPSPTPSSTPSPTSSANPYNTLAGESAVRVAVSGLVDIGKTFNRFGGNDDCRKTLMTKADYLLAVIETLNALSPYVLLFDGSASSSKALPWVLGTSVLGSTIQMFVQMYQQKDFDMSKSEQRQIFIDNSCGFFNLNENLRSILQARTGEISDVDQKVSQLDAEIKAADASAPPVPKMNERIAKVDEELKKDRDRMAVLVKRSVDVNDDAFTCSLVHGYVTKAQNGSAFPLPAVNRFDELLREDEAQGEDRSEQRALLGFFVLINRPGYYLSGVSDVTALDVKDLQECSRKAKQWLNITGQILTATDSELAKPGRRDLSKTDAYKVRQKWEEELGKKKAKLAELKLRQSFLVQLAAKGEDNDISELLDTHTTVRKAIFDDAKKSFWGQRKPGPAEAWLQHKIGESSMKLKDFEKLLRRANQEWLKKWVVTFPDDSSRKFACGYMENVVMTWLSASKHLNAAQLFCDTFSQTINDASSPSVTKVCVGSFDRKGKKVEDSDVSKTGRNIDRFKDTTNQVYEWMKDANCLMPKPVGTTLK